MKRSSQLSSKVYRCYLRHWRKMNQCNSSGHQGFCIHKFRQQYRLLKGKMFFVSWNRVRVELLASYPASWHLIFIPIVYLELKERLNPCSKRGPQFIFTPSTSQHAGALQNSCQSLHRKVFPSLLLPFITNSRFRDAHAPTLLNKSRPSSPNKGLSYSSLIFLDK